MPLDKLIDLLAEAAVRKLSQEREKQEATPDAARTTYKTCRLWTYHLRNLRGYIAQACRRGRSPERRQP
ncbi:hypothetical protein [Limimaricola cinnabarinus]|uniref:hypothetical protein n=1 Tax=Limimaricola cinnabarinus TaxID=1125964 RepID=UPI0013A61AFE|nr:hypothetical protein [Limimaricola cinnabarinus]